MKPSWDRLMKEFESSKTALVADVDCTAEGKPLCTKVGVNSYPALKYGDPNNLEEYEGGRDYDELRTFADENLGPRCGPGNMDLCDEEQKAKIEKFMAKGLEQLNSEIEELDAAIKSAEEHFKAEVEKLQKWYENLEKEKKDTIAAAKDQDLGLMKTIRTRLEAEAREHDEL